MRPLKLTLDLFLLTRQGVSGRTKNFETGSTGDSFDMQLQIFLSSRPALITCSVSVLRRPGMFQMGMLCACRIRMITSYAEMQHPGPQCLVTQAV